MGVKSVGNGLQKIDEASWVKKHRHKAKDVANTNADIALKLERENKELQGRLRELEAQLSAFAARASQEAQEVQLQPPTESPAPNPLQSPLNTQGSMQAFSSEFLNDPFAGMQLPVLAALWSMASTASMTDFSPLSAQLASTEAFGRFTWSKDNLTDILAASQARCLNKPKNRRKPKSC